MKKKVLSAKILALPLEDRAFIALREAVKKAIAERLRAGLAVYVWKDGKVVDLSSRKRPRGRGRRGSSRNSSR